MVTLACTLLLLAACKTVAPAPAPSAAPAAIGLDVLWPEDHARRFAGDAYLRGARPMAVLVWYPATGTGPRRARPMTLAETAELLGHAPRPQLECFAIATRDAVIESFRRYAVDPLSKDPAAAATLEARLLATTCRAQLHAEMAQGSYPVVIYHPGLGGNPLENLGLCERLASRGCIVVSSTFFHQEPWQSQFFCGELGTSLADIRFLLNEVSRRYPTADLERVAIVGHSFGAQVALVAACQPDNTVDAVVALDSTLDAVTVERIESPLYRGTSWGSVLDAVTNSAERCHAAVLSVSGSLPDGSLPACAAVRRLIDSRLFLATVTQDIDHEDYLWAHQRAAMLTGEATHPTADLVPARDRRAPEATAELVIAFLGQELLGGPAVPERIGDEIVVAQAGPLSVPDGQATLALYRSKGLSAVLATYRSLIAVTPRIRFDPGPMLEDMHARASHAEAVELLEFLLGFEANRSRWRWHRSLAELYEAAGDTEAADRCYRHALEHCDDADAAHELRTKLERRDRGGTSPSGPRDARD